MTKSTHKHYIKKKYLIYYQKNSKLKSSLYQIRYDQNKDPKSTTKKLHYNQKRNFFSNILYQILYATLHQKPDPKIITKKHTKTKGATYTPK